MRPYVADNIVRQCGNNAGTRLREEWVIVAAHRQSRPWSGEQVGAPAAPPPAYDAGCYLCPGNARVSGKANPQYTGTYVFDNDHPCVGPGCAEGAGPAARAVSRRTGLGPGARRLLQPATRRHAGRAAG